MKNIFPSLVVLLVALLIGYYASFHPSRAQETSSSVRAPPPWPVFRASIALADLLRSAADALTPPSQRSLALQSLYWKTTILRALTENGLMDAVDGRTDCGSIAARLGLHEDFTCRFLRAGISVDLLATTSEENVYRLTATGELFRRDHPETVAGLYDLANTKLFLDSLDAAATKSIKSGRSGVSEAFGIEIFEYFQQDGNEREAETFDKGMNQLSNIVAAALIRDWAPPSADATVCDVGGGKGTIVANLCKHHPNLKGILFDLPGPSKRAEQYIADSGMSGRVDVVAGDFFAKLPEELHRCDVFYLKAIFHDWSDEACVDIIQNIKAIARPGSKIVGHDVILGIGDGKAMEGQRIESDVTMMAMCPGGRERTQDEYFTLFENAGIGAKPRLIKLRDLTSVVEVDL